MKTIALLAQKGGAGKTTLAIHLATLAVAEGRRTVLVDMDPQRSAGDWWRAREAETPELVECEAKDLPAVMELARADRVDCLMLDTAPHAEPAAVTAARLANLVLIPCRPAILDLRAIGKTVDIVQAIGARAAIVLNSCPPSRGFGEASLTREARQGLEAYGLPVCPVAITQRAALSHALIDGRAVHEFEPDGKAAAELRGLWKWIREGLDNG